MTVDTGQVYVMKRIVRINILSAAPVMWFRRSVDYVARMREELDGVTEAGQ